MRSIRRKSVSEPPPRQVVVSVGSGSHHDRGRLETTPMKRLGRALRGHGVHGPVVRTTRSRQLMVKLRSVFAAPRARADIVLKWVRQAGPARRSIKPLNSVGERVQFDPVYHDLDDDASPGDYVRVVTPSIVRGDGERQIVLLRGRS